MKKSWKTRKEGKAEGNWDWGQERERGCKSSWTTVAMFLFFLPLLIFRLSYTVIWRHWLRPPACFHLAVWSSVSLFICLSVCLPDYRFSMSSWSSTQPLFLPVFHPVWMFVCLLGWLTVSHCGQQRKAEPSFPLHHRVRTSSGGLGWVKQCNTHACRLFEHMKCIWNIAVQILSPLFQDYFCVLLSFSEKCNC